MGRYSWNDLIINPNMEEAENAVGKECYFANNPMDCINKANWASRDAKFTLTYVKDDYSYPFVTEGGCFSCMIVRKMEYVDLAEKWIMDNDVKAGDYVKITRKAQSFKGGWHNVWNPEMDKYIGKTVKVHCIGILEEGISLSCSDTDYCFPYFVLEKVNVQYVPFTSPEEFISEYQKRESNVKDSSKPEYVLTTYGMWVDWNGLRELVTGIEYGGVRVNAQYVYWKDLLNDYKFLDGSPCGKLSEE